MSGDILDLIDGAIDAWETSVDAMRWTPEPTPPTAPARSVLLDFVERFLQNAYDNYPRELTPWQREVLAAPIPLALPPLSLDRYSWILTHRLYAATVTPPTFRINVS